MILTICLIVVFACVLVACSNDGEQQSSDIPSGQTPSQQDGDVQQHEHTFSFAWTFNDTHHWHDATCGHVVVSDFAAHTFGDWVIDTPATEEARGVKHRTCTVCGKTETENIDRLPHEHRYSSEWTSNDTHHWHDATCGHDVVSDLGAHTFGDWVIDTPATEESTGTKHRICRVCGRVENATIDVLSHTHKYSFEWTSNDTYHWHDAICGHNEKSSFGKHTFGEWIVDSEVAGQRYRVCSVCGYKENALTIHTVCWQNHDGTVLKTLNNVEYGSTVSYDGTTPTKPQTAQYTYVFSGWSPNEGAIYADTVFVAQFDSVVNKYTITWQNYDGTMLEMDEVVSYGETPSLMEQFRREWRRHSTPILSKNGLQQSIL